MQQWQGGGLVPQAGPELGLTRADHQQVPRISHARDAAMSRVSEELDLQTTARARVVGVEE